MTGKPAYPRDRHALADIRALKARGLSMDAIAQRLGMSRATLYRIVNEAGR